MLFKVITDIDVAREVFVIMKELRPHLDENSFLNLLKSSQDESGYSLLGAFETNTCIGLMGFRILTDFVHGRHLYIDDLVVSENFRSHGLGAILLQKAKEIAVDLNCKQLQLCTGTNNDKAKLFYERNGWLLKSVAYKLQIDS